MVVSSWHPWPPNPRSTRDEIHRWRVPSCPRYGPSDMPLGMANFDFTKPEDVWAYLNQWLTRDDKPFPAEREGNALWEERDVCNRIAANERLRQAYENLVRNDDRIILAQALKNISFHCD